MLRQSLECGRAGFVILDCEKPEPIAPMVGAEIFATEPNTLDLIADAFKIRPRLLNRTQDNVLAKDDRRLGLLDHAEHVVPEILLGDVLSMRGGAEGLAGEAATEDVRTGRTARRQIGRAHV